MNMMITKLFSVEVSNFNDSDLTNYGRYSQISTSHKYAFWIWFEFRYFGEPGYLWNDYIANDIVKLVQEKKCGRVVIGRTSCDPNSVLLDINGYHYWSDNKWRKINMYIYIYTMTIKGIHDSK